MPDPIDELEGFTMPTVSPLPAAEVRRRGNRLRRRNNALAAVGGLAVVAAIATPFAVMAGHQGSSAPDPAPPGPSIAWVHDIPADFPLTDGLPPSTTARDGYEQQETDACENEAWTTDGTTDVRQATYTEPSEGGIDRVLALYPSAGDADVALQALDANVQGCVADTAGDKLRHGTSQMWAEVVPSDVGERSLTYASHITDGGDTFVVQVVRVGNAVLKESTYTMGGGDPAVVRQAANLIQQRSSGTVASMCVFGATPCSAPPASSSAPGSGEGAVSAIPPDFALDRGLTSPEGDPLIGPSATADGVPAIQACQASVWPVDGVDRLAVTATGPEYLETRELVTFSSTAEITSVLDTLRQVASTCSDLSAQEAAPAGADDSVTFAILPDQGLGGGIYQFAQVGRALYATYQSGEWSAETVPAGVADLTTRTERVLPDLCIWTEQGC